MKIYSLILGTLFLLSIAGHSYAASFDCGKAASEVEKLICSDAELSKLDESMNEAYQKALQRSDLRAQTIKWQRLWLKNERDVCKNAQCIKAAYETRIKELALVPSADDYRWDGDLDPDGNYQAIPVDPEICKLYEENLRYFANRNTPMSCNRPIAPHLKKRIKKVEWEDLDPDQYPDLFRATVIWAQYLKGQAEDRIQEALKYARDGTANKVRVFRRAKLSLGGRAQIGGNTKPYWLVQYGINDVSPDIPDDVWRCKIKRGDSGHGMGSHLHLYIVSEAKHELIHPLGVSMPPSHEAQHLIMIDNRLFVENIYRKGRIDLCEIDTDGPLGNTVCVFHFTQSE
jgi:uncharacterized protein